MYDYVFVCIYIFCFLLFGTERAFPNAVIFAVVSPRLKIVTATLPSDSGPDHTYKSPSSASERHSSHSTSQNRSWWFEILVVVMPTRAWQEVITKEQPMLCRSHVRARPSTKTGLPVGHSSSSSDGPAQTVSFLRRSGRVEAKATLGFG